MISRPRAAAALTALIMTILPSLLAAASEYAAPYRVVGAPVYATAAAGGRLFDSPGADLVVAGHGALRPDCGFVSVWSGDGAGHFAYSGGSAAPCNPSGVVLADFDGIGGNDFAVAAAGRPAALRDPEVQGGVWVYTALGPFPVLNTGRYSAIVAGDFNEDGKADLAVGRSNDTTAVVLLWHAQNTFTQHPVPFCRNPVRLVALDIDRDGHLDLAGASSNPDQVLVARGNGDGTFEPPTTGGVNGNPVDLAWGDATLDGHIDLATVGTDGWGQNFISLVVGRGDGTFDGRIEKPVGNRPTSGLELLDWTGDDIPDLCVHQDGVDAFYAGDGTGSFPSGPVLEETGGAMAVRLADFDGDGREERGALWGPDVLLRRFDLPGEDRSAFEGIELPLGPADMAVIADLDGDGWNELIQAGNLYTPGVHVVWNDRGRPGRTTTMASGATKAVRAADLDRDGRVDLAWLGSNGITVAPQAEDGTFDVRRIYDIAPGGVDLRLADVDIDGDLDALVPSSTLPGISLARGTGDGTSFLAPISLTTADPATGVTVGDWNEDLVPDLAVSTDGNVGPQPIFLGDGSGGFTAGAPVHVGPDQIAVTSGDLDGDGHLDLVYGALSPNPSLPLGGLIHVLRGRGDGSFELLTQVAVPRIPSAIEIADMDRDGRADIVCGGTATILYNTLDGFIADAAYGPLGRLPLGAGSRGSRIAVGDFTGNGVPDLVSNTHLLPDRAAVSAAVVDCFETGSLIDVERGATGTIVATAHNPGDRARRVIFTLEPGRLWPGASPPDTLELPAYGHIVDTLSVAVPDSAATGTVDLQVRVVEVGAPALADTCTVRWAVGEPGVPGVSLSVAPAGPNPTSGSFQIWLTAKGDVPARVQLFTVTGRSVASHEVPPTGDAPVLYRFPEEVGAGLYFVRVSQGDATSSTRLVRVP